MRSTLQWSLVEICWPHTSIDVQQSASKNQSQIKWNTLGISLRILAQLLAHLCLHFRWNLGRKADDALIVFKNWRMHHQRRVADPKPLTLQKKCDWREPTNHQQLLLLQNAVQSINHQLAMPGEWRRQQRTNFGKAWTNARNASILYACLTPFTFATTVFLNYKYLDNSSAYK